MEEVQYQRGRIASNLVPEYVRKETLASCKQLLDMQDIRNKYILYDGCNLQHPLSIRFKGRLSAPAYTELASDDLKVEMKNGVFVFKIDDIPKDIGLISVEEFYSDLTQVCKETHDDINQSFCYNRLKMLQMKFDMHLMQNTERENLHTRSGPLKDFYNIIKVDNHIHLSACMNQKHLQKFIKAKLQNEPDTVVLKKSGNDVTLRQVFDSLGISVSSLTVDLLDCYADHKTFQRFDRFNSKYNPMGQASLREIFIKTDNLIGGRYFAEITREVINNHERKKYTLAEYRVSIYGRNSNE